METNCTDASMLTAQFTDPWETACAWIKSSRLCNFHRHISGSLSPGFLAAQYEENIAACQAFQAHYGLDPTDPQNIRFVISSSLSRVEEGWKFFEEAFEPGRFLLDRDPELKFHQRSFQQTVAASLAQSIQKVGIRATLGCHWRKPPEFKALLNAAVQGIMAGEKLAGGDGKGVLILSIRKDLPPGTARNALRNFLDLYAEWMDTDPCLAEKLFGVDSIGPEGSFDPALSIPLFQDALEYPLKVFHHLGETWEDGALLYKLRQIDHLVSNLEVSFLTNPLALLVDYQTLSNRLYSWRDIQELHALREQILSRIIGNGITLEISPTSNDVLTRKKRKCEGWQFLPLRDIMRAGVRISVTDDDGEIFETSLLDEYRKLFFGSTPYGSIGLEEIKGLTGYRQPV